MDAVSVLAPGSPDRTPLLLVVGFGWRLVGVKLGWWLVGVKLVDELQY